MTEPAAFEALIFQRVVSSQLLAGTATGAPARALARIYTPLPFQDPREPVGDGSRRLIPGTSCSSATIIECIPVEGAIPAVAEGSFGIDGDEVVADVVDDAVVLYGRS